MGEEAGDISLSVDPSHAQERGLEVDLGDPKRSQPLSPTALPAPLTPPAPRLPAERPRSPPSASRVNTGSAEDEGQRPDQPVSWPRLLGTPSPRVNFLLARLPPRPARATWVWLPDSRVGSASRISPALGLILDEPPCKPGSTAGTAWAAGVPSSIPLRGALQGLAPTPGPLVHSKAVRLDLLLPTGWE